MYGLELMIVIVGTIGCALAGTTVSGINAITALCIWRVVQGFGVGADYVSDIGKLTL